MIFTVMLIIIIIQSFRSVLSSKMTIPVYLKAIDTAEDLFASQLEIHTSFPIANHLMADPRPIIQKMREKISGLNLDPTSNDLPNAIERFVT